MPGKKEFSISFWGFNKGQVHAYLEKLLNDFEVKLHDKNHEISSLNHSLAEFEELRKRFTELEKTLEARNLEIEELKLVALTQDEKAKVTQSELDCALKKRDLLKTNFQNAKKELYASIQVLEDQFEE